MIQKFQIVITPNELNAFERVVNEPTKVQFNYKFLRKHANTLIYEFQADILSKDVGQFGFILGWQMAKYISDKGK
jgi:hypothetical protein